MTHLAGRAFHLKSALAARATLEAALERRETRGCHNRSDRPETDAALQVNLVWSPSSGVTRDEVPPIPAEIAVLMDREMSVAGKLLGQSGPPRHPMGRRALAMESRPA